MLASKRSLNLYLYLAVVLGTSLVIASACVLNNYIDRSIDKKMKRTKNRALVSGVISIKSALIFTAFLGISGFLTLFFFTNKLTVIIGVIGYIFYIAVYGIAKRKTSLSTLVGSVSGAMPPVAGYVAVKNRLDLAVLFLFLIMVFWQMAHFFSIALYRLKDYSSADIPLTPIVKGIDNTKKQIIAYILLLVGACIFLSVTKYTGLIFAAVSIMLGAVWIYKGLVSYQINYELWGKKMFLFSLIVIATISLFLSVNTFLI